MSKTDEGIIVTSDRPDWGRIISNIRFYSNRLTSVPFIDDIFRYQDGTITTEFVSGTLTDGTVQPPNSKLFEYIVMMSYLSKFGLLTEEGLSFRRDEAAADFFTRGNTLLPCLCMQQTTGYTDNNALYDMDFGTLIDLADPNRAVALPENYANCLGVDIKIKGVRNIPTGIHNIPDFDYADSIRAIDKLATLIDNPHYFIQFLGFYQKTDKSVKQIRLNQDGMYKFRINSDFAIACIGRPDNGIWLQLLRNKFLFFNVKNEELSTTREMMRVWQQPTTDSGLNILKDRLRDEAAAVETVFHQIEAEIYSLPADQTVLNLLERGVVELNRILPDNSPLVCRSNSTQRNPQVKLYLERLTQRAAEFLIPFNDGEFPEISLPKTKRQLAKVVGEELKILSYTKARTVLVNYLKDEFGDQVRMITNRWNEENPNIGARRAAVAPVQYLFDHLLYYPYRSLREGQETEIQDTITRVINRRRRQIPVRYTFNIPLLRRIKNVLKREVRENPRVDTFGSLHDILQGVFLRHHNPEILRDQVPQQRAQPQLAERKSSIPETRSRTRNKLLTDDKTRAKESVHGKSTAFQRGLRQGQGGGGRNSLQITYKLIIPTLLLDLDDLLNMDLKNYNLEDYENHPIWSTIKNLYCFIDSVNNDNYQNFSMKKMYDFWIKSEELEFIVNILDPFKKIVITYNKYINKYFDNIVAPKTIQHKPTPRYKPRYNPILLTPQPKSGGRKIRTRKKRRKKKKSRRKRRK